MMENVILSDQHKTAHTPVSPHSLNKNELRASMVLPIILAVGLVVLGGIVWLITPDDFNTGLAVALTVCLFLFLIVWTRKAPVKQRLLAIGFAVPSLLGVSFGMSNGRLSPMILGVSLTILLLVLYRAVNTPLSYRFAARQFRQGNLDQALTLIDKAIAARPHYWESYQLKSLIFLAQADLPRAERAAKEAITVNPQAATTYNSLGQIYLAQARFAEAQQAYVTAVEIQPDNALYWYHLGLCQFRLAQFEAAGQSLAAASKRSPRLLVYELLTYYYLWRSLQESGQIEAAAEALDKMQEFSAGLPILQAQIEDQPETAHLPFIQADLQELARQLKR